MIEPTSERECPLVRRDADRSAVEAACSVASGSWHRETLRSAGGPGGWLSSEESAALIQAARAAYDSGRFRKAATLFAGLEATSPGNVGLALCRAAAEHAAGRPDVARMILDRWLHDEAPLVPGLRAEALLLRATVLVATDRAAAQRDLDDARALAKQHAEARAALEAWSR